MVRVWIQKGAHGLMQVVGYDRQGKALKRMRVTNVMNVGVAGAINSLMGRRLGRYTIQEARFERFDPVTGRMVDVTHLSFDKP
jgi:negative regulator of sigma E activity